MTTLRNFPSWSVPANTTWMLESEWYGFHGDAVSTVFRPVVAGVAVFTFGEIDPSKTGMPKVTVDALATFLMPKLAPKIVMVAAALKGADGAGLATAVLVPPIDEIVGGEY